MIRKISYLFVLSLLLIAFMALTASAAKKPVERRVIDPRVYTSQYYSFPDEHHRPFADNPNFGMGSDLGNVITSSAFGDSPGDYLGITWYDYQRNGSMRRMVAWGQHTEIDTVEATALGCLPPTPCTVLVQTTHFNWMRLVPPLGASRHMAYQAWISPAVGSGFYAFLGDGDPVQPPSDWAGYVTADVTNDDRAVLSGHNDQGGGFQAQTYWDRVPTAAFWRESRVPDAIAAACGGQPGQETIWPAMAFEEGTGTAGDMDTVTHLMCQVSSAGTAGAVDQLYYFRKVGGHLSGSGGTWTGCAIDTTFTLSHDIFASDVTGKVIRAWTAPLPNIGDPCDTCSGDGSDSQGNSQLDNDVYWQTSDDQGASWNNRINLTKYPRDYEDHRAYIDLNILIDADDGEGHILFSARRWGPEVAIGLLQCRLITWGEGLGFNTTHPVGDSKLRANLRTVHNAEWDQTECNGGAWQMNLSKMTMSQCNGRHYAFFIMFNDIPNGVTDDCADRAFSAGDVSGSANGELWVSVSNDDGLTWDESRNLTNSYSKDCDSATGVAGACEADQWPSSAPYGNNWAGDYNAQTEVIPGGGAGDHAGWFIDVMYQNDQDAGGIPQNNGSWQPSDTRYIRVGCVSEVPNPQLNLSPPAIDFPSCAEHNVQKNVDIIVENAGNVALSYTPVKFEDNGPTDWLTFTSFDGGVPSGLNNIEIGTVHLNTGGMVNAPGTIVNLVGGIVFSGAFPTAPDTLLISHWVADTCVPPTYDTISTSLLSLIVNTTGNFGDQGRPHQGLSWARTGLECDTTNDVYVYDASPFIGWVDGSDTIMNWSIFGDGWLDTLGFRSRVGKNHYESYLYECYSTGPFTTNDSTIYLEKTWYAPRNYLTGTDQFVIQCLKVWSCDGLAKPGISVGEYCDWDIPSDTGVDNGSGFDAGRKMIYCQGGDYADGDTTICDNAGTPSADRYGGTAYLGSWISNGTYKWDLINVNPVSMMSADQPTYVHAQGGLVPGQLYGLIDSVTGFSAWTSNDTLYTDLGTIITALHKYDLGATDTIKFYTVWATTMAGISELETFIDAGIDFDQYRVCYGDWRYPCEFNYDWTAPVPCDQIEIVLAGNVTGGTPFLSLAQWTGTQFALTTPWAGAVINATHNPANNTTVLLAQSATSVNPGDVVHIGYGLGTPELCVLSANWGNGALGAFAAVAPIDYFRICMLNTYTGVAAGSDTLVFKHSGFDPGLAVGFDFYNRDTVKIPLDSLIGDLSLLPDVNATTTAGASLLSAYVAHDPNNAKGRDALVFETLIDSVDVATSYVVVQTTIGVGPPSCQQNDQFAVGPFGCCITRGNINGSGDLQIDISDLTYLVGFMFGGGAPPPCMEEGNVNGSGDGQIDISDLTFLVGFMFGGGAPPPPC